MDYWKTQYHYAPGGYANMAGVAFGVNVGYKFVLPFGLYFRTGSYLGATISTKFDWYNYLGEYKDSSGEASLFGFLDLAIGYNFKLKK